MLNCDMGAKKSGVALRQFKGREADGGDRRLYGEDPRYARPVPFGALIVNSKTGERLLRAVNAVAVENDPSSHAELRAVRLACKKLKQVSLAGYTMYSTCEPCPMCMANALWARLDRVVFGATHRRRQQALPADSYSREERSPPAAT